MAGEKGRDPARRGPRIPWVALRLLEAAQILRERGHCKTMLEAPDGSVCARGAICAAVYSDPFMNGSAIDDVEALVLHVVGQGRVDVTGWNDWPKTSTEEVIETLEAAASMAISEEEALRDPRPRR